MRSRRTTTSRRSTPTSTSPRRSSRRPPPEGLILGVDPGLASTGYAVLAGGARPRVVVHGTLRTPARTPHARRLSALAEGIAAVIAEHPVVAAAVEQWFIHQPSRAAMGTAEARGAVLAAIAAAGVEVVEYAPNRIKQAVTAYGGADKQQVRSMVTRLLGVEPGTDHAADALAAAFCHAGASPLAGAIRLAR